MHDELMALAGRLAAAGERPPLPCPDPVNAAMIRNWTQALGDAGTWDDVAPPAVRRAPGEQDRGVVGREHLGEGARAFVGAGERGHLGGDRVGRGAEVVRQLVVAGVGRVGCAPADAEDVAVLRIVVRDGFNADLASDLVADIRAVCAELAAAEKSDRRRSHFAH